ncbi:MAG: hypothetical protein F6K61_15100 [Sphaerospermopsis sp. SIO1G1]|nr:hypothetical protein [Sphaerospermopsis sp. SIO1G1]
MKNSSNFVWVVFFLLIVPLAIHAVYSGLVVGKMELPGGFRIVFQEREERSRTDNKKIDDLPKEELEKRQKELEERFEQLEKQADRSSRDSQSQDVNLSGTWYGQQGGSYQIIQQGKFITMQEFSPLYGVTAVGQGEIRGQTVTINYQTAFYTTGIANLTISENGRSLNGTLRDNNSGLAAPIILNR